MRIDSIAKKLLKFCGVIQLRILTGFLYLPMSKAADKIRQVLQAPLGPNVPSGASRQFVNLVKAIGEAGSNHVRTG